MVVAVGAKKKKRGGGGRKTYCDLMSETTAKSTPLLEPSCADEALNRLMLQVIAGRKD